MIRLPPTSISLGEEDIQYHLQRLLLRHTLVAQFQRLRIDDDDTEDDDARFLNFFSPCESSFSSGVPPDSDSEFGFDTVLSQESSHIDSKYSCRRSSKDVGRPSDGAVQSGAVNDSAVIDCNDESSQGEGSRENKSDNNKELALSHRSLPWSSKTNYSLSERKRQTLTNHPFERGVTISRYCTKYILSLRSVPLTVLVYNKLASGIPQLSFPLNVRFDGNITSACEVLSRSLECQQENTRPGKSSMPLSKYRTSNSSLRLIVDVNLSSTNNEGIHRPPTANPVSRRPLSTFHFPTVYDRTRMQRNLETDSTRDIPRSTLPTLTFPDISSEAGQASTSSSRFEGRDAPHSENTATYNEAAQEAIYTRWRDNQEGGISSTSASNESVGDVSAAESGVNFGDDEQSSSSFSDSSTSGIRFIDGVSGELPVVARTFESSSSSCVDESKLYVSPSSEARAQTRPGVNQRNHPERNLVTTESEVDLDESAKRVTPHSEVLEPSLVEEQLVQIVIDGVLADSVTFRDQFDMLVAGLENEDDNIIEFGNTLLLRRRSLGP